MSLRALVFGIVATGLSLGAGQRAVSRVTPPASMPREVVERVQIGQTTPQEIEQQFGPPHGREEDGAMVYQSERVRRQGDERRIEQETTTFRFERGVLSRVCRTRS
jgi:hypothetical protein